MDTEKDLSAASRETLLEIISQQQAIISDLQQRIVQLEAQVSSRKPPGMPGIKPSSTRKKERQATRQPRPKGFARCRTTPTQRVQHQLDQCPDCGTRLKGGWVQKRREVIDILVVPVQVTEHVYLGRRCPCCGKDHTPKVELQGVVAGKGRLGINLVSLIVTLKEEARLPVRTIQWYLRTVHQLALSVGSIVELCQRVAHRGQRLVDEIRDRVRASPVVHADETGWRQDGHNGYAWTFSTARERYFVRGSRGKCVVQEVLGVQGRSVLVTDFYAAYNTYPGLHQRCWAHLLRDIHELGVAWPDDEGLQKWSREVQDLFTRAKEIRDDLLRRRAGEAEGCRAQLQMCRWKRLC